MKLAIAGATGQIGSRIAAEAFSRGHAVTGFARNADKSKTPQGVALMQADLRRPETIIALLRGQDALVTAAYSRELRAEGVAQIMRGAGIRRLLVVGGAGSLEVAPGRIVLDSPSFPEEWKPEALGAKRFLEDLRAIRDLDWTFLSPAAELFPGERTGAFRVGGDQLLVDAQGLSRISIEDYAVAVLDELENPQHIRARFTVAY